MLPAHVLFEKAADAVHKAKPAAILTELEAEADAMVARFQAKCLPPKETAKSGPDPVPSTSPPPPAVPAASPAKPPG